MKHIQLSRENHADAAFTTFKKAYSLLCEEEKQRGPVEHKGIDQIHALNVKTQSNFK